MIPPLVIAGSVVAAVAAGTMCRAMFAARSQIFGRILYRGPRDDPPRIALTFDDGPHASATPRILDILREHGAQAAFFVVGNHAAAHPKLLQRMHAEGHLIGNHSFDHAFGGLFHRDRYWLAQINRTDNIIEQIVGVRPALFRPPMGFKTHHVTRSARCTGHFTVTWSRRGRDGVRTVARHIARRLSHRTVAGDIILLHDGVVHPIRRNLDATIDALPKILQARRTRGLHIIRLDELLGVNAYQRPLPSTALPRAASSGGAAAP